MSIIISRQPLATNDIGNTYDDRVWPAQIISYGSDTLVLGFSLDAYWGLYIRFPNILIPPGAIINSARLKVGSYHPYGGQPVLSTCYFNAADNAVSPISFNEYDNLPLTSGVQWNIYSEWLQNETYFSPNLAPILQEIVDRGGWTSGNALVLLIKPVVDDGQGFRAISGFADDATYDRVSLEIEYRPTEYEGATSESVITHDQIVAEVEGSVKGAVVARFDDPFNFTAPAGYRSWGSDTDPESTQTVEAEISEGFSTDDGNAVEVSYGEGPTDHEGSPSEAFTMDDSIYAELPWETEIPESGTVGESFTTHDEITVETSAGEVSEGMTLDDEITASAPQKSISEAVSLSDEISAIFDPAYIAISENVTTDDLIEAPVYGDESEDVTQDDSVSVTLEIPVTQSEGVSTDDEVIGSIGQGVLASDTAGINDFITIGWIKSLTSSAEISDAVTVETALGIHDTLLAQDTIQDQWVGSESVVSTLGMFGNAVIAQVFNEAVVSTAQAVDVVTFLHSMVSDVESVLGVSAAVSSIATFNPLVSESVAIAGTIAVLRTLNDTVNESAAAADTVSFSWLETILDGGAIADAAAMQWAAMHILTDSIAITDAAVGLFNFTDAITETLEAAAALSLKQSLQNNITEILDFGITIELDGELWECWVLNTDHFYPSVYSGYGFNSFAVYNNAAYGCKADGIYKLSGSTDDGDAFNSGIVMPQTQFGSSRNKRFRKAYFGISGTSPSLKLEDETEGSQTYTIVDSKVNVSRTQKGKKWTLKLQGFDDLDFVELVPVILTR